MPAAPKQLARTLPHLLALPLIGLVKLYRLFLSPLVGQHCRFTPTCSQYAIEALQVHGAIKGSYLTAHRLCRCHPWGEGGYDPVPLVESGPQQTPASGVASSGLPAALILSLAAHAVLIGTLIWFDHATQTRAGVHVTEIALLDDRGTTATPAAASLPTVPAMAPHTPAKKAPPPATPAAPTTPAQPAQLAVTSAITGIDTTPIDTTRLDTTTVDAMRSEYARALADYLRGKVHTPPDAGARGLEGRSIVTFTLDRSGNVLAARVSGSSGEPLLDRAALVAVTANSPLPPPPAALPFTVLEIDLPVLFPPQ